MSQNDSDRRRRGEWRLLAGWLAAGFLLASCQSLPRSEAELAFWAREARTEGQWVAFDGDPGWVAVHSQGEASEAEGDARFVLELIRQRPGTVLVTFYHVHPVHSRPSGSPSPPSAQDIRTHALLKRMFRDRLGVGLRSKVSDGTGLWEYDVTAQREEEFRFPDFAQEVPAEPKYPELRPYYQPWQLRADAFREFEDRYRRRTAAAVEDRTLSPEARGRLLADEVRALGVLITFEYGPPNSLN